jgi:hypothetical protein
MTDIYFERAEQEIARLYAENGKLRAENADMKAVLAAYLNNEREALRAALKPFARMVNAESLFMSLAHITREDLLRARDAFYGKQDG